MLDVRRNIKIIFVLVLLSCMSASCSLNNRASFPDDTSVELDVFMARGYVGGSEFERYHIDGDLLWRECGTIKRKKTASKGKKNAPGDNIFPYDPNLSLEDRTVESLQDEQLDILFSHISETLEERKKSAEVGPPPGSIFSFSEPGLIEVRIGVGDERASIITNVDATAESELPALKAVKGLVEYVRGVGAPMCNARTFFGLSRSAS